MPSNKKSSKSAAEPVEGSAAASAVSETDSSGTSEARVDLMDSLEVGSPALEPVPATFQGVDFAINRYYSPATIWRWSDLSRKSTLGLKPTEVAAMNRAILELIIVEDDHDKIDELMAKIDDRSDAEARRIYTFLHVQAGLTDRRGNPLAL